MTVSWSTVAQRIADALALQPGMLVQVSDRCGRPEVVAEVLLALEARGVTSIVEYLPPDYLRRLLDSTDPAHLGAWDRHRAAFLERVARLLVLGGDRAALDAAPHEALAAWQQATGRLVQIEEERRIPLVLAAVPTETRAIRLGMRLAELESIVLPAIAVSSADLRREIDRLIARVASADHITIGNPDGTTLKVDITGRRWLTDTGEITAEALAAPIQPVINLPAGSVYTTVVEESASGRLLLAQAGPARNATLTFEAGRVTSIDAAEGSDALAALFDRHSGEPRRISHIGIGLNPRLHQTIDWELVDEHRHGSLFVAFGENRYLGGQNASSLNIDFVLPAASLFANDHLIVDSGQVA